MFLRIAALFILFTAAVQALDMPPRPVGHVNDYAKVLSADEVAALERNLTTFERETTDQIVISIFPSLENEDLADFSNRLFEKWHLGQKDKNNGVLIAVFLKEHKVRIEVGYGLEGALTDALSSDIIRKDIVPAFRQEHYGDGLRAAVEDIEKAIRGEYTGTGEPAQQPGSYVPFILFVLFMIFFIYASRRNQRNRGVYYPDSRYGRGGMFPWIFFPPTQMGRRNKDEDDDDDNGKGSWSSGSGGGGGFSGGGGLSGGGGASGSW